MEKKRFLLVSDTHLCHIDWYGVSAEQRMEYLVQDLREEYEKDPYEMILFLGDYSLDFWKWQVQGSYLARGVSETARFIRDYCKDLPAPYCMLAGNHEQYGRKKWVGLAGSERSFVKQFDGFLLYFHDSYAENLDPTEHHDGVYTPMDASEISALLARHPDKKLILLAHYFDANRETPALQALLGDPRILCVLAGHNHKSVVLETPPEQGAKKVLYTGHYSYSGEKDPTACFWGYRELVLSDTALTSEYIVPAHTAYIKERETEIPYHRQDGCRIEFEA